MKGILSKYRLIVFIILVLVNKGVKCQNNKYSKMLDTLIKKTIPIIDSKILFNEINYHIPIVLLDAREIEEYKISHIENAIHVGYNNFDIVNLNQIPKDRKIVIYCSVGYRSEKVAETVYRNGYNDIYNLYGGIFDWINKGFPVVDSAGNTRNIHPYDENWGNWLEKGIQKYE